MTAPCMVKNWLYVSYDRYCRPGNASSARMARARMPAKKKKASDVTKYRLPITL